MCPAQHARRVTPSRAETAQQILQAFVAPRTVLVVDDEPAVRDLIAVMLELEGHRVLQAGGGAEALELAASHEIDLITLDVMMPDLDGWSVSRELDRDPRTARIPRVMVSGKPLLELEREQRTFNVTSAALLAKPFDFVTFIELVRRVLEPQAA